MYNELLNQLQVENQQNNCFTSIEFKETHEITTVKGTREIYESLRDMQTRKKPISAEIKVKVDKVDFKLERFETLFEMDLRA